MKDRHIIQKYLDNELSKRDMKRFEAELDVSPEMQADLNLYREVDEALADTEVLSFRDQLKDLRREAHDSSGKQKSGIRFTRPWHYAATAAIALMLAIGLATILDRPFSNKDLLKRYYKPYEVALINRSNDAGIDLALRQAEKLYQEGDFEQAVVYFEVVLEEQPEQIGAHLYSGISYFELERFSEADNSLSKVIDHQDNLYVEQAEWYLGLCFLATNETDRARRQFAKIASSNSFYRRDAEKILRKVRL